MPGDRPLVEQGVADRPRRIVFAQPPQEQPLVEAPRRSRPGPSAASRGSTRARASLISSSTGPSNWTHLPASAADARARPGAAHGASGRPRAGRSTSRSCAGASGASGRRRSAANRCLPCASTDAHRPAREPLGQRSMTVARLRRRGSPAEPAPRATARIRCAAWWIVSPSGIAPTIAERGLASPRRSPTRDG